LAGLKRLKQVVIVDRVVTIRYDMTEEFNVDSKAEWSA